ncbi:NUDIX hydrolase [Salipiger mucosus]|uniref:NUDIX domain protein n=1 Tax=Salipiger mucosus DSM 16094 TaxID=1123237 RepID=S9QQT2_9RHOB|nr:NUDIX hydrolase [Salipiger mucosus]EPX81998.1 NUDIX domain protein [Salipiger mucosus DSM 16094]
MTKQPKHEQLFSNAPDQVPHLQYAALCYRRRGGKLQILMITSRGGRRWTLPKGWPMRGRTPAETAAREAWEEAGVRGTPARNSVGGYTYRKRSTRQTHLAMVFPIEVSKLDKRFPERRIRKRRWVSRRRAAEMVAQPDLAQLLLRFDPDNLGR